MKNRPPDLNQGAVFDAVQSGRVDYRQLSPDQREAYQAELHRRRLAELMEDEDKRDAAKRSAARRAEERKAVAAYYCRRERAYRERPAKRRRALRVDLELLSDFTVRQSFAALSAAVAAVVRAALESFLGALSGRRPVSQPPASRDIVVPPGPKYSDDEVRAALAEYRERIRQLKAFVARIPELPGRTPRDIAAVAIEYLDYKLSGLGGESFPGLSRRFFAAVNAADTEMALAWRSELDRALSGGARCVRELREIDAVGAELDDYPELGRPLPGLLPPPDRRRSSEVSPEPEPAPVQRGPQ